MRSMTIVPKSPPRAPSPPFMVPRRFPSFGCASHSKLRLMLPTVTVVFVFCSFHPLISSSFVTILFSGFPKSVRVHSFPPSVQPFATLSVAPVIALMTTSPNESESPTTAGTKQSQINSLRLKSSMFSQRSSLPATKCSVKSGENIAYTQSLMIRIMSMNISAITSTPNTTNIRTHTMSWFTSCPILCTLLRIHETCCILSILNTP